MKGVSLTVVLLGVLALGLALHLREQASRKHLADPPPLSDRRGSEQEALTADPTSRSVVASQLDPETQAVSLRTVDETLRPLPGVLVQDLAGTLLGTTDHRGVGLLESARLSDTTALIGSVAAFRSYPTPWALLREDPVLVLYPTTSVSGRIVTPAGVPLEDLTVVALEADRHPTPRALGLAGPERLGAQRARTDREGIFAFPALRLGANVRFGAGGRGWITDYVLFRDLAPQSGVELEAVAVSGCRVDLVDEKGAPLSLDPRARPQAAHGLRVRQAPAGLRRLNGIPATLELAGLSLAKEALPPASFLLLFSSEEPRGEEIVTVDFELPGLVSRSHEVRIISIHPELRREVVHVRRPDWGEVRVAYAWPESRPTTPLSYLGGNLVLASGDRKLAFEAVPESGEQVLSGIPFGHWTLSLQGTFLTVPDPLGPPLEVVVGPVPTEVELQLPSVASLEIEVLFADGRRHLGSATVNVGPAETMELHEGTDYVSRWSVDPVFFDEPPYTIGPIAPGDYYVLLTRPFLSGKRQSELPRIHLAPGERRRIRIRESGGR